MRVFCPECLRENDFDFNQFRCDCGGAWEVADRLPFQPGRIDRSISSLWRYANFFGFDAGSHPVSLGAGWTPILSANWKSRTVDVKLEYISPTGSFKDRGVEIEVNYLRSRKIFQVVEDSSGNAGAALAAYCARADIGVDIYAPASAAENKLAQIAVYGADLHKIPGPRVEASKAVLEMVGQGATYASHAYHPIYLMGQETFAWEVWEQYEKNIPTAILIPTGQGGLLLGAWFGFSRLLEAGLIQQMPRLFAVQPQRLAPIYSALEKGLDTIPALQPAQPSIAEGLAIVQPVRGKRILQALRESRGGSLVVTEQEIRQAHTRLARMGLFVEPSSAIAAAAIDQVQSLLRENDRILVVLTGSGLKSSL